MKVNRQLAIRKVVEENELVSVSDLSLRLAVSESTIRRDLDELSRQGFLSRTHGGAMRARPTLVEPPMLQRMDEHPNEKKRIGCYAANLIQDGETIFLGSGTTVLEIARAIPQGKKLTVITNSLPVINLLTRHPQIELIVIGGLLRQSELSMIGHLAEKDIQEFRADKAFMGMHAIDAVHGLTNDHLPEVSTDRAILKIASEVIIVAHHSKFGMLSSVRVAPVTAARTIITDHAAGNEQIEALQALGVQVIQV